MNKKLFLLVAFAILLTSIVYSQTKEYGKLKMVHSNAMNKDFPILVFLPETYKPNGDPFPVIYFLHGVNNESISEKGLRNLYNEKQKLLELASLYKAIIVTPIVGNSFYIDSPINPEFKFATYVGKELPEFIDKEYKTVKSREGRILAGFSMGGHGAVSLLCRFPDTFSSALSIGGVMDLDFGIQDYDWDDIDMLEPVLGKYWNNMEAYHKHSCMNLVNKIKDRKDVAIVLAVGREDFLLPCNRRMMQKLGKNPIPHIYTEIPGGHDLGYLQIMNALTQLQFFKNTIF